MVMCVYMCIHMYVCVEGPSRKMFSKPVIAAVSGYAVAGGLELSLMCDMRVMEESAIMGVFCRRFGECTVDTILHFCECPT